MGVQAGGRGGDGKVHGPHPDRASLEEPQGDAKGVERKQTPGDTSEAGALACVSQSEAAMPR